MEARGGTLAIAGIVDMAGMVGTIGTEATTTSPTGTPPKLLLASKTGSETALTTSSRIRTHVRRGPTKVTVTPTQDQPPATTVRGRTIAHNGSSQSASAVKNGEVAHLTVGTLGDCKAHSLQLRCGPNRSRNVLTFSKSSANRRFTGMSSPLPDFHQTGPAPSTVYS